MFGTQYRRVRVKLVHCSKISFPASLRHMGAWVLPVGAGLLNTRFPLPGMMVFCLSEVTISRAASGEWRCSEPRKNQYLCFVRVEWRNGIAAPSARGAAMRGGSVLVLH